MEVKWGAPEAEARRASLVGSQAYIIPAISGVSCSILSSTLSISTMIRGHSGTRLSF